MLCQLVSQPVVQLIQVVVAAIQYILIQICRLIEEVVRVVTEVLKYNPNAAGNVDQNLPTYILSDRGRPLVPMVDRATSAVAYFEVAIRGDVITGELRRRGRELVPGRPFLYMPHKVMEIASHLFGDIFAGDPSDDGRGATPEKNLFTYAPPVQAVLATRGTLARNNYNVWPDKYTNSSAVNYFGDRSLPDMGVRVDTDFTCSRPTNTFLHLVDDIGFTPGNTAVAEEMNCGAGQTLTFDETNFLMLHKHADACAVTTYFVSSYEADCSSVGCNDLLGYTTVTFENLGSAKVLEFTAATDEMMARIVDNVSGKAAEIVRVAETYLHELGHQSGLLHDEDVPDCADDTTLAITKIMAPGESVRRAFTGWQWCVVRGTCYFTSRAFTPFLQTAELAERREKPPEDQP